MGRRLKTGERQRRRVSWISECFVPKLRNCFGFEARDSGQRRVPEPPLMMIGMTVMLAYLEPKPDITIHTVLTAMKASREADMFFM